LLSIFRLSSHLSFPFSLYAYAHLRYLPSFPTRRSSDLLKLKCIFYRTFMYRVKYATASGIIEKHYRSNIKVKTLPMCWKCAWKKHWTFLAISRKSSENCRRLPMLVWDILNSASLRRHCQDGKRNVLSLRVNCASGQMVNHSIF